MTDQTSRPDDAVERYREAGGLLDTARAELHQARTQEALDAAGERYRAADAEFAAARSAVLDAHGPNYGVAAPGFAEEFDGYRYAHEPPPEWYETAAHVQEDGWAR